MSNFTVTITQNNSLVLGLTATTPITYGTITDFTGSGCPAQLSCSLNISNAVYSAGTISANYSTSGNANYTSKSAVFTVTINKANSQTSLTFDKTSPQNYLTAITPTCSLITGVGSVSLTNGTSGVSETLGAGAWDLNCSYAGNTNYTASSNFSQFTINKITPSTNMQITGTTPIIYPTTSDFSPAETNTGDSGCSYSMDKSNLVYGVGTITFNYSTSGCANYTSGSVTKDLVVNQNTGNCNILFNESSPLIYPNKFKVYSDCNSEFVIYRNSTIVSNNSEQSLSAGTYNFTVIRNDSINYTYISNNSDFTINKATGLVYLFINNSRSNFIFTGNALNIYLNATLENGVGNIFLYLNNSLINLGTSPIFNLTNLTYGDYFANVTYLGNENYTSDYEIFSINITEILISTPSGSGGGFTNYSNLTNVNQTTNEIQESLWKKYKPSKLTIYISLGILLSIFGFIIFMFALKKIQKKNLKDYL